MYRRAARVLVQDGQDRVLLFRGFDPADPDGPRWWFTAGGGIEAGETEVQGAIRELREETGIRAEPADLTGPVHHDDAEFGFNGRWIVQSQVFYRLRRETVVIDTSGFEELEVASTETYRWWSAEELRTTTETVYPANLVNLLDGAA